jgi:hypothetical protein
MKLYHGTGAERLSSILQQGLKPRGRKKGNWSRTVESNPQAVYLTNSYPLHFAGNSAKNGEQLLVIEIDTDRLNPFSFAPDEDFLEQASRKDPAFAHVHDSWPGVEGIRQRTLWFRKRVLKMFSASWQLSVEHLGTCCYYGDIEPNAITRWATTSYKTPLVLMSDPTITLLNYKIMGAFYRDLVRRLFGDEMQEADKMFPDYAQRLRAAPRDGIIVTINPAAAWYDHECRGRERAEAERQEARAKREAYRRL